jgi:hypothetical protein
MLFDTRHAFVPCCIRKTPLKVLVFLLVIYNTLTERRLTITFSEDVVDLYCEHRDLPLKRCDLLFKSFDFGFLHVETPMKLALTTGIEPV